MKTTAISTTALIVLMAASCPAYGDPLHSGDGRIVFHATYGGNRDIYAMNPDGTNVTALTTTPNSWEFTPRWSPDGTKIAFCRSAGAGQHPDIWVMNTDGSGQKNLTNTPTLWEEYPTWAPDGSQIAYSMDTMLGTCCIYVMNADGTDQTQLSPGPRDGSPDWSPDGTKIVFTRLGQPRADIFVVNPDGTHLQRLTQSSWDDFLAAWSPDGSKILFLSARDSGYYSAQIFVGDFNVIPPGRPSF